MAAAITLKSGKEIELLRRANELVAGTLNLLYKEIRPGMTTAALDRLAEEYIKDHGARPAFKGYRGYPATLCVSINDQVVHGIPSRRVKVREGDIVSVDVGTCYKGYYGDAAISIPVGDVSDARRHLMRVTRESLRCGIEQVRAGHRVSDISRAVQGHVEAHGYHVVTQFVGHGIGSHLHEPPEVPNYVREGSSPRLLPGMVLAIEPMVNMGTPKVKVLRDGWTVVTADKSDSAHFEHSVVVTENEPMVLSAGINEFDL